MVSLGERARAYFREREWTTTHRLDRYLTEHLPRLVREHELATQESLQPIDEQLAHHRETIVDLEGWKGVSTQRLEQIKRRIGRLEVKHGLGSR